MAEKKTFKGYPSKALLDEWKNKYGKIFQVVVPASTAPDAEQLFAILRKPNMSEMAVASSLNSQDKTLDAGNYILDNCKLACSQEIETEDLVRASVAIASTKVFTFLPKADLTEL